MPKYGSKYISDPDEKIVSQTQLFVNPKEPNVFPRISTDVKDFYSLLSKETLLGTDFEFHTKKINGKEYYSPTIIAVSSPDLTVGLRYTEELARACVRYIERGGKFVAYSTLGADKPVLEQPLGITTPLEGWHDALLIHYFANQALTKTTSKEVSDDAGSLGYMNLWTAASLVTDLPLWKRCLRGDTKVLIEGGIWKNISALVTQNYRGRVYSITDDGELVLRRVTDTFRNARNGRRFYKLDYEHSSLKRGLESRAILTEDHEVLTTAGWKQVQHITSDDFVATGEVAPVKLDILAGMLLGDSHLEANGRFRLFHTDEQGEYLDYKVQFLSGMGSAHEYRDHVVRTNPTRHVIFPTRIFWKQLYAQDLYRWCYENFTEKTLALWFLDDGHRTQDNRCEIACTSTPIVWVDLYISKIKELGIDCFRKDTTVGPRIQFNRENSKKLSQIVAPLAPPCMRYKLEKSESVLFDAVNYLQNFKVCYARAKVKFYEENYTRTVYCLEVEETNNFITRGGVVHNCTGYSCYSENRVCPSHKPIQYCAVDSWAGLMIYLEQWKKLKKFNFSYDFYRSKMELGEICTTMQTNGVKIDTKYVKEFDEKGEQKKELLFDFDLKPATKRAQKELERLQIPLTLTPEELREYTQKHLDDWQLDEDDFVRAYKHFNPRSPQEIIRYFKEYGIDLSATDKKYLQKKLEQIAVSRGLESIADIDDPENVPEYLINLYNLWMLKNEGKGIKAWFGEQYVDEYGYAHPRWLYTGASSGRLSSSGPNFMNIPARGFGEQLRKAVIPRDPSLELYKADKSQLELRMVLHCAGVDQKILGPDAFVALVEQSGDDFYKAAKAYDPVKYEKDPKTAARNIAKVFSHSNSYLIGIKIIPYAEVESKKIRKDVEDGILVVYRKKYIPWLEKDWEYGGGIVAFTGKHLAETAYGSDTKENRKKALEMQENVYFKNDRWGVRRWQMKLTEFIETNGYAQHSCGSFLELYSSPAEAAKIAAGFIGQGQSAHYMQELMLNYRALGITPLLQVHDELVFEQVKGRSEEEVKEFFRPMRAPSKLFDGFSAPIEIKRGPNWKDLKLVGKI